MSTLRTLIELAEKATDESALALGKAVSEQQELEKKLVILKNYREEYAVKLQAELKQGRDIRHIRNFQLFIGKIDDAITVQQHLIKGAQQRVWREQHHWQEQERKKMSYVILEERAEQAVQKKEMQREQKQHDEYGIRQLFYR